MDSHNVIKKIKNKNKDEEKSFIAEFWCANINSCKRTKVKILYHSTLYKQCLGYDACSNAC